MRTIFTNCKILTMNVAQPEATALVLEGSKILFVGNDAEAVSFKQSDSSIIDGQGASLVPGFNDSHMHLLGLGVSMNAVDCRGLTGIAALKERVKEKVQSVAPGAVITGRGWDQNKWTDGRYATCQDLDEVAPEHPVILTRACGHVLVANSLALQQAGVDANTMDIEGGSLDRDEQGQPTGVFRERAMGLVRHIIPASDAKAIREALQVASQHAVSRGLTSVQTNDGGGAGWEDVVSAYHELKLPLRANVQFSMSAEQLAEFAERMHAANQVIPEHVGVKTIKVMADGSLGARTAALSEPYSDAPNEKGLSYYEQADLNKLIVEAHQAGFQVAIHAIGDYTAEQAITAIEYAQGCDTSRRHRMVHCQVLRRDLVERMAKANIIAEIQPVFLITDLHWTESRVGKERLKFSYAWKSLLEYGVNCSGGSDCPVEVLDPLLGIGAAVTRADVTNWPEDGWLPQQKLSVREAVALFTVGSAYAEHMETTKGLLKPGYLADMVLLSGDIEAVDPFAIKDLQIKLTMVNGMVVYKA
ncbi:MAG: hypothetical protein FD169_1914 [Bacillota bacterium]|nr:MAG: hypothetical protein FD169_1914 [Bacillota bacterium]